MGNADGNAGIGKPDVGAMGDVGSVLEVAALHLTNMSDTVKNDQTQGGE